MGDSYDFDGRNLTAYGGLLPVATMLEKLGIPATGGRDADGEADHASHADVPVRAGDGVGAATSAFRGCIICAFWSGSRC